jgi:hypothetical protein
MQRRPDETVRRKAGGRPKLSIRSSAQCCANDRLPDQPLLLRGNLRRPNRTYMGSTKYGSAIMPNTQAMAMAGGRRSRSARVVSTYVRTLTTMASE